MWYDNIPVLSYIRLRGLCRRCGRAIGARYPLVEFFSAGTYWLIAERLGTGPAAWKAALFASLLLILFCTDLQHLLLPDEATLGGLALGIGLSPLVPMPSGIAGVAYALLGLAPPAWLTSLTEAAVGATLFGGGLYLVGQLFYRVRGIEGLGLGDVKLVAMIAAFLGSSATLLVLLSASLLATLGGTLRVLQEGRGWHAPIPLGSYLAASALAALFTADRILAWYWEFMLPA